MNRVILLSDGNANAGLTDVQEIAAQCEKLARANVSTSTYGLGRQFNEDLMVQMAMRGGGSNYYGDSAQDLFEPFDQEFSLLANLWSRRITLRVLPAPGVQVRLLNQYLEADPGEGELRWRLPDVAFGSEAWALLELTVPKSAMGAGDVPLCTVRADAQDLDGVAVSLTAPALALASLPAAAFGAVAENELVSRRLAELQASQMLREAREASDRDDWARVDALLAQAQARFADNPWVAAVLESMQQLAQSKDRARFMKEALYSASNFSMRLAEPNESVGLVAEAAKPSFLRRKREQGKAEFERRPPPDSSGR